MSLLSSSSSSSSSLSSSSSSSSSHLHFQHHISYLLQNFRSNFFQLFVETKLSTNTTHIKNCLRRIELHWVNSKTFSPNSLSGKFFSLLPRVLPNNSASSPLPPPAPPSSFHRSRSSAPSSPSSPSSLSIYSILNEFNDINPNTESRTEVDVTGSNSNFNEKEEEDGISHSENHAEPSNQKLKRYFSRVYDNLQTGRGPIYLEHMVNIDEKKMETYVEALCRTKALARAKSVVLSMEKEYGVRPSPICFRLLLQFMLPEVRWRFLVF